MELSISYVSELNGGQFAMNSDTREKYLQLISDKDAESLKVSADKLGKKAEEFLNDILTLSVVTTFQGENEPAALTKLYFDGDIDVILPRKGETVDHQTLELHQRVLELALQNRRESIRMLLQLFDLKDLARLI